MNNKTGLKKSFARYVSTNIVGMIGISAYILADTFFISLAVGADGITALNLVLPLYNLIYALGSMLGVGSATRFTICRARKDEEAEFFFSNAVWFAVGIGLPFVLMGAFIPGQLVRLLGGDAAIVAVGKPYARIFLLFAPFFMLNYVFNAFVRNDGSPALAMTATFSSSLFNIVGDYVLMFPFHMGMAGAALATVLSPVIGILICSLHFLSKKNTISFRRARPSFSRLVRSCQLGTAAFMGEISTGVTTMLFNFLILELAGNTGVAAYGIIANVAIVATSIFNGVSQGAQPLLSDYHGRGDRKAVGTLLRMAAATALALGILILVLANVFPAQLVAVFNSEGNAEMAAIAEKGVRLYFMGFVFAGFNIVGTGYLSATEKAGWALATSILRGVAAISGCAVVLSRLFGMTGVWLAFPAAELITALVMLFAIRRKKP